MNFWGGLRSALGGSLRTGSAQFHTAARMGTARRAASSSVLVIAPASGGGVLVIGAASGGGVLVIGAASGGGRGAGFNRPLPCAKALQRPEGL